MLPRDEAAAERARSSASIPELPPLPVEPKVQPGPEGKPYTLADFQRLAAANSPTLRQAASDVEAAKGNLIQAKTYPNPIVAYVLDPSNNNNTAGVQGGAIDQPIITGGKMKLGVGRGPEGPGQRGPGPEARAQDLATSVRNAYFTLLVDVETLVVTRALAQFSDEIYRLQTGLLKGTQAAPYEPTALRAQTYINRLAYKQAIASYIYDWKALVATLGLPQLPLSEVAGQVDRFIPYYDYDEVRAYVLQNHTDILTARNGVKIAQYNLKLAQVTPVFPDLDVSLLAGEGFRHSPFGTYQTARARLPAAHLGPEQGEHHRRPGRAGPRRRRIAPRRGHPDQQPGPGLRSYRNNLYAMEYYRRNILPDLVRYYRGIYARRQIDPSSAFGDLVFAQQNLSTNVTTYIGILGSLWTSVVGVADFLQTDDLYQLAKRHELPELPDFTPTRRIGLAATTPWRHRRANGAGVSGPDRRGSRRGLAPPGPAGGVPVPPGGTSGPPPVR